jgi:CO/xanthine dehydrogenase FAD-binding subunit
VGPTALLITEANESLLQRHCADEFAQIVEASVAPINDHRATAEYRSTSIGILARRMHQKLWNAS